MGMRSFHIGLKSVVLTGVIATLSACATPPTSSTAGPGSASADPAAAGLLFAKTCIATAPKFTGLPAAISAYPMTQNANTGTFYHNQQDLSIKRIGQGADGYCSIVVGSNQSLSNAAVAFGDAVNSTSPAAGTSISLGAGPQLNGRSYLNARIDAQ